MHNLGPPSRIAAGRNSTLFATEHDKSSIKVMLAPEDPAALVGAVLNRKWRLIRLIGEGGLGLVYAAQSATDPSQSRAIKVLRDEFRDEPEIVERFLSEARASSRMSHPGIVRVDEAETAEDGSPYLVMELLEGAPLTERMNRGRLSVEQAAPIAHHVLHALEVAHQSGVVHRDLKPDNIFLVNADKAGAKVKVLDFGLARVIDAAGGFQRKTRTGMLLGTPGYMSPEQIRDVKGADSRADLWSVGVIFYEMLTGKPAFPAENEFARVTAVLTRSPEPIEVAAPQYAHWAPFFSKALASEAAERFQSAAEMIEALLRVAQGGQMPLEDSHFNAPIPMSSFAPSTSAAPTGASVPPPADAMASVRISQAPPAEQRASKPFGGMDTAVSPGASGVASAAPEPVASVRVVSPQLPVNRIPWGMLAAAILISLGVGFVAGAIGGPWPLRPCPDKPRCFPLR